MQHIIMANISLWYYQNRYIAIEVIQTIDEHWDILSESLQTSKGAIPPKHRIEKNKWLTDGLNSY